MALNSFDLQRRSARFTDQRWLLDQVIELVGPEWDQGRLGYLGAPMTPDHVPAVQALRGSIRKLDDFCREMAQVARHFELRAAQQKSVGHLRSAADDHFAAAVLYGGAQWPIYANTPLVLALERKKTENFLAWAEHADHHVERVEVPFGRGSVAGYLHLPAGYSAGELPAVVLLSGMDGFKELSLFSSGDRYLSRGFAVLALDGPGQGESLSRGIWYDPDTIGELGTTAYEFCSARAEIDPARIAVFGLSQGSFWATQLAAAEPRYAAAAVMYTCFDPGNRAMFESQSPTFVERFMYMTGTSSEAELRAVTERMTTYGISERIQMPYLVLAGEDDPLTDLAETIDHVDRVPAIKQLVVYAGEDHAPLTRPSGRLGPNVQLYAADWLADRAAGRPLESAYITIDRLGRVHQTPWNDRHPYTPGALFDLGELFTDQPGTGLDY